MQPNKATTLSSGLTFTGCLARASALAVVFASNLALAAPGEIPELSIRWNCGDCEVNPKVIPLIQQTYREIASTHQMKISSREKAEAVITEYRQRPPAARVLLGAFYGTDRLSMTIKYHGTSFVAKDSAATVINGMNAVCKNVAQSAYKQLNHQNP